MLAQIGEDAAVGRAQESLRATSERAPLATHREHALDPVEQRMPVALLRLDVDRLEAVERILDRRQRQIGRIGARKSAVAIG